MSDPIDGRLVVDALERAAQRELPPTAGPVEHSAPVWSTRTAGVQYASEHDQILLRRNQITDSMSRRGNRGDDAPMERFFATLNKELVLGTVSDSLGCSLKPL